MSFDETQASTAMTTEKVTEFENIGLCASSLTDRVRSMTADAKSVFDGDPSYESFFSAVCRNLHRGSPRHVLLLRERGVGEQAALVELAKAGVNAQPDF